MPTISCYYYNKRGPYAFTFIQFENFVKVVLNRRIIILTNQQLATNSKLFEIFVMSLLFTEDTSVASTMYNDDMIGESEVNWYGVMTHVYEKNDCQMDYRFISLYKSRFRNPLIAKEPKRATGQKKVRKFMKLFHDIYNNQMTKKPPAIINDFFQQQMSDAVDHIKRYIEHERKITMLSVVLNKCGMDVCANVMRFL
jgi:hypothetical protein